MPVRPTALSEQVRGLVPRLYRHIRNKAFSLPSSETIPHNCFYFFLTCKVVISYTGKEGLLSSCA